MIGLAYVNIYIVAKSHEIKSRYHSNNIPNFTNLKTYIIVQEI